MIECCQEGTYLMTIFELSIGNAWLLSLPFFVLVGTFPMLMKKDLVKRMSDMTGYTPGEKVLTVAASISPYAFMIATVWVPFTTLLTLLYLGLLVSFFGMALCAASLKVMMSTPPDTLFTAGPYGFSRNPLYVSATVFFIGICLATGNLVLTGYLAIMVLLQHFMILAEERICRLKYGEPFDRYVKRVPRYLIVV
jgi:protein-S-isoprenylcysteine O-methyltransferase Ste14